MAKSADAFRTISEVADWLGVPTHVLRFWESKFPQVKPVKRAGGRRYYRPSDMILLAGIRVLLHDDGVTIRGVQKILREKGVKHVAGLADREVTGSDDTAPDTAPDTASAKPDGGDTAKVVDLPRKSSPEPVVEKPQTTAPAATEEPTPAAEPAETPAEASEPPGAEAADADRDAGQMPLFASDTAAPERPEPDTAATAPAAASTPDAADTHPPAAGRMPDLPGPSPASRAALGPVVTRIATGTGPEAERLRTALAAHRDALEALRARLSDAPQTPGSDAEG